MPADRLVVHAAIFLTLNNVCVCYHLVTVFCVYYTAVECPALQPIPNGAITYGPDTIAPFDVGTVATHRCNDGFVLVGSETRTCLFGSRWSGLIPVCRGT